MKTDIVLCFVLFLCCALPPGAWGEGRHIAIIIDTSGSMDSSDRPRYTVQLSQIISELLDAGDELNVIRLPNGGSCYDDPDLSLALRQDPLNRPGFKQALDNMISYSGGNDFAAPIRTAIQILSYERDKRRMLLIIADSGGLDCESSWGDLKKLHDSGAVVAAINIGSSAGAFDGKPAFDFTTAALNSEKLVAAVARVYQKFLGAKQVQTGSIQQKSIQVEIAPFVAEAFLVVAADGPVAALQQTPGNPKAKHVDLNHGSGETVGLDGQTRGYLIARLDSPAPGQWSFAVPGLSARAGWMLIQDSAVSLRLITPPVLAQGVITPLEIELYDRGTGLRITDSSGLTGLDLTLNIEGQKIRFTDDGIQGDRLAGDGIFTGQVTFNNTGQQQIAMHLESDFLDKKIILETEVIEAAWKLLVTSPVKAKVSDSTILSVELHAIGPASKLKPPGHIEAVTGGPVMPILHDNGIDGDQQAGDRIYSGVWIPDAIGKRTVEYIPIGGTGAAPANAAMEIVGDVKFGKPIPVDFGQILSHSTVQKILDLRTAMIKGDLDIRVSSNYEIKGTALEIDLSGNDDWVALEAKPADLHIAQGDIPSRPVRLRTGRCPSGSPPDAEFTITVEAVNVDGEMIKIPLSAAVVEEAWLTCWWPAIAAVSGFLTAVFIIYGLVSPSRFPPRLGVMLSPEEDMSEGFFHPVRAQRGTGSGFYRNARAYICQDFRISGASGGALACLRALGKQIRIQAAGGGRLWRQTADGAWEKLPAEETIARFGVLYKDELGTLFFEIRNG